MLLNLLQHRKLYLRKQSIIWPQISVELDQSFFFVLIPLNLVCPLLFILLAYNLPELVFSVKNQFVLHCSFLGVHLCVHSLSHVPSLFNTIYCSPSGSSVHGNFPGKNTGEGCCFLLQGIFLTQGLNLHLLHLAGGFFVLPLCHLKALFSWSNQQLLFQRTLINVISHFPNINK